MEYVSDIFRSNPSLSIHIKLHSCKYSNKEVKHGHSDLLNNEMNYLFGDSCIIYNTQYLHDIN